MNIRNIALVAGLVAIAGVANAQSFELRAGAGVQSITGNTINIAPGGGDFTVQIWAVVPSARTHTSMNIALGYAWSNATANNNATAATAVNNKLGNWAFSNVQSIIAPVGTAGFRRSTATAAGNFTVSGAGITGVNAINAGYSSGVTPASFNGSIHIANVTFSGNTLANNEIYGDDANEFGLQLLANGSTSAPTGAGYSGLGGTAAGLSAPASFGSVRYNVQAVPEPATMAALGLGLAAMARRRRNKK